MKKITAKCQYNVESKLPADSHSPGYTSSEWMFDDDETAAERYALRLAGRGYSNIYILERSRRARRWFVSKRRNLQADGTWFTAFSR